MNSGLSPKATLVAQALAARAADPSLRETDSPWLRTALDWTVKPRDRSLAWYEDVHKAHGFVFATPAFYVMGRPVRKYAPIEQILDVEHVFDFETCDTWFIFLMAGDTKAAWRILPWDLPWMCWVRDNDPIEELRFFETARLKRLSGVES